MEVAGKLQTGDGSTSTPGVGFRLDPNTGLFRPGADRIQVVTGGTAQWEFDASGHLIPVTDNAHDVGSTANSVRDLYVDGQAKGTAFTATSFTSALHAGSVNPTMGSGATVQGYYQQTGKKIEGWVYFQFGAGMAAGTGQYIFVLPANIDTSVILTNQSIGMWHAGWGGTLYGGTLRATSVANEARLTLSMGGSVSNSTKFDGTTSVVPVSGDSTNGFFSYVSA